MPDANTLYYTFSTTAQVLAAIIAITAVFVLFKSGEYKIRMQREMGNAAKAFNELIKLKGKWPDTLKCLLDQVLSEATYLKERGVTTRKGVLRNWKDQANKSRHHGIFKEMKDIFEAHSQRPALGERMQQACKYAFASVRLNDRLLCQFSNRIFFGLALIFADLFFLMLTSEKLLCQFRSVALVTLVINVSLAGVFLWLMGSFVNSTIKED